MKKILRYNSAHHLWFPRGSKYGRGFVMLNPITVASHGEDGKETVSLYEPLWLYRLRTRLFRFAGKQRCRRRDDFGSFNREDGIAPDSWEIGPDGNRTCNYCGSIHPDDFTAILERSKIDSRYRIEGSTKSYKYYIKQPDVRNASEGAIKFYTHHAKK